MPCPSFAIFKTGERAVSDYGTVRAWHAMPLREMLIFIRRKNVSWAFYFSIKRKFQKIFDIPILLWQRTDNRRKAKRVAMFSLSLSLQFFRSRRLSARLISPAVFLFALFLAAPAFAGGSTPDLGAQLFSHYKNVGAHFRRGENLLAMQTASRSQRDALLVVPLPSANPAHKEYSRCAAFRTGATQTGGN